MSQGTAIAIIGGTGAQGLGLALRLCAAGRSVAIGSRAPDRAARAAEHVRERVPGAAVEGMGNAEAAAAAALVVLSVPFEHTAETLKGLRERLAPGQILVSMGVPIASAIGDGPSRLLGVWQGSCAELVADLAPDGVEVVSALQNVSAGRLSALDEPIESDVVVSGAKAARARVMEMCELVPGLRAVDGGPLANARIVESLTALLIGLSARYKVAKGVGLRFTGLPE
jgi:NADPH-dependent F420 reductase